MIVKILNSLIPLMMKVMVASMKVGKYMFTYWFHQRPSLEHPVSSTSAFALTSTSPHLHIYTTQPLYIVKNMPLRDLLKVFRSKSPAARSLPRSKQAHIQVDYNKPHVDLVGPPDPISNIRPIRYKQTSIPPLPIIIRLKPTPAPAPPASFSNLPTPSSSRATLPSAFLPSKNQFYAENEFPAEGDETHLQRVYRREREALDEWSNRFWTQNNIAYHQQRADALAALPPQSNPPTAEEEEAREKCIDEFHKRWVENGAVEHKAWMIKWWSETARLLRQWIQLQRS